MQQPVDQAQIEHERQHSKTSVIVAGDSIIKYVEDC